MKKMLAQVCLGLLCALAPSLALAQSNNLTITWTNITSPGGVKLASGEACFQMVDRNGNPTSVQPGGGGTTTNPPVCVSVTAGATATLSLANCSYTSPPGPYYNVTVQDTSTNQVVVNYPQVPICATSGSTFSMDSYAPGNVITLPPTGGPSTISGNFTVGGTLTAGATTLSSLNVSGNTQLINVLLDNPGSSPTFTLVTQDDGAGNKTELVMKQTTIGGAQYQLIDTQKTGTQSPLPVIFCLFAPTCGFGANGGVQWGLDMTGNFYPVGANNTIGTSAAPVYNVIASTVTLGGDPTAALQAATKQYVDSHSGGGSGGALPAGAAGQVVATPATGGAATAALTNEIALKQINSANYASQFTTFSLQNGIGNAVGAGSCSYSPSPTNTLSQACVNGNLIVIDPSYGGYPTSGAEEPIGAPFPGCGTGGQGNLDLTGACGLSSGTEPTPVPWPVNTTAIDQRGGSLYEYHNDPISRFTYSSGEILSTSSGNGDSGLATLASYNFITPRGNNQRVPEVRIGHWFDGGQNGSEGFGNKSFSSLYDYEAVFYDRGQHSIGQKFAYCRGIGDCQGERMAVTYSVGLMRGGDEGENRVGDSTFAEDFHAFHGLISSITGSAPVSSIKVSSALDSSTNEQGAGRWVIDLSDPLPGVGGATVGQTTALGGTIATGTCTAATTTGSVATMTGCSSVTSVTIGDSLVVTGFTGSYTPYNVSLATVTAKATGTISFTITGCSGTCATGTSGASAAWSDTSFQNIEGTTEITSWTATSGGQPPIMNATSGFGTFPAVTFMGALSTAITVSGGVPDTTQTIVVQTTTGNCSGAWSGDCSSNGTVVNTTQPLCISDSASFELVTLSSGGTVASGAVSLVGSVLRSHGVGAMITQGGSCGYFASLNFDAIPKGAYSSGLTLPAAFRHVVPLIGTNPAGTIAYYWYTSGGSYLSMMTGSSPAQQGVSTAWSSLTGASFTTNRSATYSSGTGLVTVTNCCFFNNNSLPYSGGNALYGNLAGQTITILDASGDGYAGTFTFGTANGPGVAVITGDVSFTYTPVSTPTVSSISDLTMQSCNCSVTLYPGAEVTSVFNQTTQEVDGTLAIAGSLKTWNVGDLVEEAHGAAPYFSDSTHKKITFYMPQANIIPVGDGEAYSGNISGGLTGFDIQNNAGTSLYYGYGGTELPPNAAYGIGGFWRNSLSVPIGPDNAVINVGCKPASPLGGDGCTKWDADYSLFQLSTNSEYRWWPQSLTHMWEVNASTVLMMMGDDVTDAAQSSHTIAGLPGFSVQGGNIYTTGLVVATSRSGWGSAASPPVALTSVTGTGTSIVTSTSTGNPNISLLTASSTTASTAALITTNTVASGSFIPLTQETCPNATASANCYHLLGFANATNNAVYDEFHFVSTGSATNYHAQVWAGSGGTSYSNFPNGSFQLMATPAPGAAYSLTANHLQSNGGYAAPSVAAGTGAGSSPTLTLTHASDSDGIINLTTGTSPTASATVATITFGTAFAANPNCSVTPASASAMNVIYSPPASTTAFTISAPSTALTASTAYTFTYSCLQ